MISATWAGSKLSKLKKLRTRKGVWTFAGTQTLVFRGRKTALGLITLILASLEKAEQRRNAKNVQQKVVMDVWFTGSKLHSCSHGGPLCHFTPCRQIQLRTAPPPPSSQEPKSCSAGLHIGDKFLKSHTCDAHKGLGSTFGFCLFWLTQLSELTGASLDRNSPSRRLSSASHNYGETRCGWSSKWEGQARCVEDYVVFFLLHC